MEANTILIADDEPSIVRVLTYVLQKEGFVVENAFDGEEAWEKIQKLKPKVVFLDIMMPKKDGYEICRLIKSHPQLRKIYVVILTARVSYLNEGKFMAEGADEYITKPFSPRQIIYRLSEVLKEKIKEKDDF